MTDLFIEKSKDWDTNNLAKNISSAIGPFIIKYCTLSSDMNVMDFGAGTGLISSHIAPFVNKITAVDISKSMLEGLVKKPELQGKVEACCQDIITNPLNTKFDLIVSAMAMHHVENTQALLDTFFYHLKKGGTIALADLDKEDGNFHPKETEGVFHFGFKQSHLMQLLIQAGFQEIRFLTVYTVKKEEGVFPIFLVSATKPL